MILCSDRKCGVDHAVFSYKFVFVSFLNKNVFVIFWFYVKMSHYNIQ